MNKFKKYGLLNLTRKCITVIATSLGLLSSNQSKALPQLPSNDNEGGKNEKSNKRPLKPKLILKLNSNNPEDYGLAFHGSHSSHSSHASHRSHYSSSSGDADEEGGGGGGIGGLGIGALIVGGVIAYGFYQSGKNKSKK